MFGLSLCGNSEIAIRMMRKLARRLRDHLRASLAGYKLPKHLVVVDQVVRSPAGKADYRWAKATAESSVGAAP